MLFASTALARRIERAECRLLIDSAEATAARRQVEVLVEPLAGGVATSGTVAEASRRRSWPSD